MHELCHIAIIMDGNGRWAKALEYPRTVGHVRGADVVYSIIDHAIKIDLGYLTLFTFSRENWKRPTAEISSILELIRLFVLEHLEELKRNDVVVRVLGRKDDLSEDVLEVLQKAVLETQNNKGLVLNIAFNYSGRDEIVRAVKNLVNDVEQGNLLQDNISEKIFSNYLDTKLSPDPDLLIRTSGEKRISNFLLWQIAYCEFYFCDCYWPDFGVDHFIAAIEDYKKRHRRFGDIKG